MYLDYLRCGELNLPLSVPLYTCESVQGEGVTGEIQERRRAGSSRRSGVGIDCLFSVALLSFSLHLCFLPVKGDAVDVHVGEIGAHDKQELYLGGRLMM